MKAESHNLMVCEAGQRTLGLPCSLDTSSDAVRIQTQPTGSRSIAFFACLLTALLVLGYRVHCFANFDPRVDQAGNARFVQEVRVAERFLPQRTANERFRSALEADSRSALNRVLRFFYDEPQLAFNTIFFWIEYFASFIGGTSYRFLLTLSIAASVVPIVVVPLWALGLLREIDQTEISGRLLPLGIIVAAVPYYSHIFAPWGVHNFGSSTLVIAALASTSALRRWKVGVAQATLLLAFVCQFVSFYTHWTNVLILPAATVAAILLMGAVPLRFRVEGILKYGAIVALIIAPVVVLMFSGPSPEIVFAGLNQHSVKATLIRAIYWLQGGNYFSFPGVLLGVGFLIFIAVHRKIWLPLMILAVHFCLWTFMPGFTWNGSPTALRTCNYVIPFLSLGVALAICWAVRQPKLIWARVCIALCILHISAELFSFATNAAYVATQYAAFKSAYLDGQGSLRKLVAEVDASVPGEATLIIGDYHIQDAYYVLSPRKTSVDFTALDSLERHAANDDLVEYIQRRKLRINCSELFILGRPEQIALSNHALEVFSDAGFGCATQPELTLQRRWDSQTSDFEHLELDRVYDSDRVGTHSGTPESTGATWASIPLNESVAQPK